MCDDSHLVIPNSGFALTVAVLADQQAAGMTVARRAAERVRGEQ